MTNLAHVLPPCPPALQVGGLSSGGRRIPLFRRRTFDLELVQSRGTIESFTVARGVRVEGAGQAVLLVCAHANAMGTSRTATVRLLSEAPSRDDPSLDFLATTDAAAVEIVPGDSAGTLRTAALVRDYADELRAIVDLRNDSTSTTGGGTIELSADLLVRPGAAAFKRRFVGFTYSKTDNGDRVYVPFREDIESIMIGVSQTLVLEGRGRVEMVAVWASGTPSTTRVRVHFNGNTTAAASVLKILPSSTVTNYFPSPLVKFSPGDRLHISVDPTNAPGDVVGTVVLRMDEETGS